MRYVVIAFLLVMPLSDGAPPPFRVMIDCSSEEREGYGRSGFRQRQNSNRFNVNSFCNLIHNAIPDGINDGRFILDDMDQAGFSDTQAPISVPPPQGFIPKLAFPKLKTPKLKVPKIKVPTLKGRDDITPPRLGSPISRFNTRSSMDMSSAERMEVFKKGVQKMLHVVKVLGQIDQYISERTRMVIDKLSKTLAD